VSAEGKPDGRDDNLTTLFFNIILCIDLILKYNNSLLVFLY